MPPFETGQANWNEALGGIASLLYPDQSKEAQAYYHGALARKAQIEGNKAISEQNAMTYLPNILSGQQPNYSYRPAQLTGASPILNPAQNLPGVAVGMPGPPALSSAFAPSPQAVAQAAANTPAGVEPLTRGTPPPYISPAPGSGAPMAPTSTTSNGQRPQDEVGSGPVHPMSFNTTGGGTPGAPPARSNGSPAQPMINAAQYALAQSMAGVPEPVIKTNISTYFGQLHAQGSITDRQYYDQLASVGITTPLTQTIGEAGATTRQGMSDKAAMERARLQAETQRYTSDISLRTPGTYTVGGELRNLTPSQSLTIPGAIKAPGSASEAQGLAAGQVLTSPPGPGRQAALSDVYSLGTSAQTVGPYSVGGKTATMAAGTAAATPGAVAEPTSESQQVGRIAAAASDPNATPEQRAAAQTQLGNLQYAMTKGKPPDANQLLGQQVLSYNAGNQAFGATQKESNKMPVMVLPQADQAIRQRAAELMNDERLNYRDRPDAAYQRAMQEKMADGTIENVKDIQEKRARIGSGGWFSASSNEVQPYVPPGSPPGTEATPHVVVGLKGEGERRQPQAGQATPFADPLSGTLMTPPPGTTAPPPTPSGAPQAPRGPTPAPTGRTGGATITIPGQGPVSLGTSLGPLRQPPPPDFTMVMVNGQQAIAIGGQAYPIVAGQR